MIDLYGYPVEREVARRTAGNIDDSQTEVGVAQVCQAPGATPSVGGSAQEESRFGGRECGSGLRGCPSQAAIPGELHAHARRPTDAVHPRVQTNLDTINVGPTWQTEAIIVKAMLILSGH